MTRIPQVSAYKSLPNEITRSGMVNKKFKKAQKTAAYYAMFPCCWGLAAICQFLAKNIPLGAMNLCLTSLYLFIFSKNASADISELRSAYKEIVARAKNVKKSGNINRRSLDNIDRRSGETNTATEENNERRMLNEILKAMGANVQI